MRSRYPTTFAVETNHIARRGAFVNDETSHRFDKHRLGELLFLGKLAEKRLV